MGMPRMMLRLRYLTLKLRALWWVLRRVLRRLRAGRDRLRQISRQPRPCRITGGEREARKRTAAHHAVAASHGMAVRLGV